VPHSSLQGLITPKLCGQCQAYFASRTDEMTGLADVAAEGYVREMRTRPRRLGVALALACAAAGAGCAGGGGAGSAAALPAGSTCQSIKGQLSRLDAKGVRGSIESQSAGRKLSPGQKADADAYNSLLNDYLKARCHEMPH
jgi:hypothetical protein